MDASKPVPILPVGLPDDWVFSRDVTCPTCRYNLRMLRNPRCPECGVVFRWQGLLHIGCPRCGESLETFDGDACPRCDLALDWGRLLSDADPAQLRQFEYTQKPIRAAMRTMLAVLRPERFWAGMQIETPPAKRRLRRLRYAAYALFAFFVVMRFFATVAIYTFAWGASWFGAGFTWYDWLSSLWPDSLLPLCACLTALLTSIVLPLFTPTLSRFRIRGDQMVRLSAYASIGVVWCGVWHMTRSILYLIDEVTPQNWALQPSESVVTAIAEMTLNVATEVVMPVIAMLGAAWWLRFHYVALRHYLRLDRANTCALLLSSQIIAMLAAFTLFMATNVWVPF